MLELVLLTAVPLPFSAETNNEKETAERPVLVLSLEDETQLKEMAEEVEQNFQKDYADDLVRIEKDVHREEKKKNGVVNRFKKCLRSFWLFFDPLKKEFYN